MVQLSSLLVTGADGRWHPGIGDPSVVGWVTVVAYVVAAALALRALRLHRRGARQHVPMHGAAELGPTSAPEGVVLDDPLAQRDEARPHVAPQRHTSQPVRRSAFAQQEWLLVRFWGLVAVTMLALGLNKQLDLQTWFTEVLRDLARAQGWWEARRPFQVAFIALIGLCGTGVTVVLALAMRQVLHRVVGALFGLGALVTFVIVRAASFHHVDVLLGRGRVRLNWVLELGGIALIAISALRQTSTQRDRQRHRHRD
jgi:hypothetical protein